VSSRFQFVEDHRGAFGVKRLCRILAVSRSGFYQWLADADARARWARADPASARSARSPTNSDQLRWPPPHDNRCPCSRGKPGVRSDQCRHRGADRPRGRQPCLVVASFSIPRLCRQAQCVGGTGSMRCQTDRPAPGRLT
jgi:hypothetical protein